eukprot:3933850-Rhodomonas_salina.2
MPPKSMPGKTRFCIFVFCMVSASESAPGSTSGCDGCMIRGLILSLLSWAFFGCVVSCVVSCFVPCVFACVFASGFALAAKLAMILNTWERQHIAINATLRKPAVVGTALFSVPSMKSSP